MFSRFFIDRPIFATVVSLLIVLAGIVSINNLPVENYPNLTPPTITVQAKYPGANAETLSETVLAPLEQKINGVEDMIYMNSVASANSGEATISVYFKVGTDPDMAMINVNNRVQQANASLPEITKKYGVNVLKKSSSILTVLAFYCDNGRYDSTYVGNYVSLNIVDALKRIEGVGEAQAMAGNEYAMRIWLKPDKLAKLNLSAAEIAAAVAQQNEQRAAGAIGKTPMSIKVDRNYIISAQGRLTTEEEFGNIIIRANEDGTALRLRDVADIELGAQTYDMSARMENGVEASPIMISLAPGANALATQERIDKKLEELSKAFPEGIKYRVAVNTTKFVKHSINEVVRTLFEAIVLVFCVILLFLKNFRATLIPSFAVPVSIIGAFAGMLMFGFSINTLTLFGLVLAIGIVVDDAIVVIENVERIMRVEKLSVRDATIKAMDEVSGALIAIVLVLCAVFVPVSFMSGMSGTMYRQFAITIAVSVVISGLCALTLTPALCVVFLKGGHSSGKIAENKFFKKFDIFFDWLTEKYVAAVSFFLRHRKSAVTFIAAIMVAIVELFHITPTGLVPDEDQGFCLGAAMLDPASSLEKSENVMRYTVDGLKKDPAVDGALFAAGFDILSSTLSTSSGTMFVMLKDFEERKKPGMSVKDVMNRINRIGFTIPNGLVFAFAMPPISGMDTTGGVSAYIQETGVSDSKALEKKVNEFVAAASKCPELTSVRTTFNASTPQMRLDIDVLKALSLGVSIDEVYNAIGSNFNSLYINDFSKFGRGFKVMIQAKDVYRAYPENLNEVYVKSAKGAMIPVSSFAKLIPVTGPTIVERFNIFQAAKIMANPAPGYSSGQAIAAIEKLAREQLGSEYTLSWTGSAYQEKENSGSSSDAIVLGMLVVFLILAALYERWTLPFAVLMTVPFAVFGAIVAIAARSVTNDIYFQVALITLVGLSAKNAILITEFAVMLRKEGLSLIDAAIKAAHLRFRPIVMTSLAFILGCVPLAVSTGAGSACRQAIGTSVIGGMLGATILAPLFVPLFYVFITGLSENFRKTKHSVAE